jgi:hypothetical protein
VNLRLVDDLYNYLGSFDAIWLRHASDNFGTGPNFFLSASPQPFYNRNVSWLFFVTKKLYFSDTFMMNAGYTGRKLQGELFGITSPTIVVQQKHIFIARQAGRAQS